MTQGPAHGDRGDRGGRGDNAPQRQRHGVPARFVILGALLVVVFIFTGSSSMRTHWAHWVHDVTGGNRTADYLIGLAVALLPVLGVLLGAFRTRGPRRVFRMFMLGALGFVLTYLLAPSPAGYLIHHSSTQVFDREVPGYLAGVFTAAMAWLAVLLVGVLRARARWRRFTQRHRVAQDLSLRDPSLRDPSDRDPPRRIVDI
ncbi:MAG: hypothetical protein QOJ03_2455 [Frankiaceae bacterium]|jgi:hypothetical protein|nr:hypothetical protein [Frankiaceae bacterium]